MATSKEHDLSGYQHHFLKNVKDYDCPICLHVTREPSLTSCCGQHFCQACIQKILTEYKPCPLCKQAGYSIMLDKKQKRRIFDLQIYCAKKGDGCRWTGTMGNLQNHADKCRFYVVDCPNKCGTQHKRRELRPHILNCAYRPFNCRYCQLSGPLREIKTFHLSVCPKYPVACPNECGVAPPERGQLEGHLRECPLAMVECELKELGCEEVVQRKDADKHMEETTEKHMKLMTLHYAKIVKNQASMTEQITKFKEENKKLKTDLKNALHKEVDHMTQHLSSNVEDIVISYDKQTDRRSLSGEVLTYPSKCSLQIFVILRVSESILEINLDGFDFEFNDYLQWPKMFTMTVKLLNKLGDQDHHVVTERIPASSTDLFNNQIIIPFSTIDTPPAGVKYVDVDNNLKLRIYVTEMY